ncbi:hypothetical protein HQ576_03160, partial [bacterium]|nr:hypothetical protein [bacterium]
MRSIVRRAFLRKLARTSLAAAIAAPALAPRHARAEDTPPVKPNIVFVLADDLGWAELGCTGSRFNE